MGHGFVLKFDPLNIQCVWRVGEGSQAIGAQLKPCEKVVIGSFIEIPSIGAERSERRTDKPLDRTHISRRSFKRSGNFADVRRPVWPGQQEFGNLVQPFFLEGKFREKGEKIGLHP
jgi:hypothetical protein